MTKSLKLYKHRLLSTLQKKEIIKRNARTNEISKHHTFYFVNWISSLFNSWVKSRSFSQSWPKAKYFPFLFDIRVGDQIKCFNPTAVLDCFYEVLGQAMFQILAKLISVN